MTVNRTLAALGAAAFLVTSCAGVPQRTSPSSPGTLLDYKGKAEGASPPAWASMEIRELEALPEFRGLAVFRFEESGKNLESLRRWTAAFSAPSELSSRISTRAKASFDSLGQGDRDRLSDYFRLVVESVSETELTGFMKYDEWWALHRLGRAEGPRAGAKEYTYYSLYVLPKSVLKDCMAASLANAALATKLPADAAESLERSRLALSDGFGGL